MSGNLSKLQGLYLWSLLSNGGSGLLDIKPKLEAKQRKQLVTAGLIEESKEKFKNKKSKRTVTLTRITLSDKGWAYLTDNHSTPVNAKSPAASDILQALLGFWGRYLKKNDIALAEIFGLGEQPSISANPALTIEKIDEIWKRLEAKWDDLAEAGGSIRLAILRRNFADIEYNDLDKVILSLQDRKKLVINSFDVRRLITDEDAQAAIDVAGRAMHIIYKK